MSSKAKLFHQNPRSCNFLCVCLAQEFNLASVAQPGNWDNDNIITYKTALLSELTCVRYFRTMPGSQQLCMTIGHTVKKSLYTQLSKCSLYTWFSKTKCFLSFSDNQLKAIGRSSKVAQKKKEKELWYIYIIECYKILMN